MEKYNLSYKTTLIQQKKKKSRGFKRKSHYAMSGAIFLL